ncbi:MAG TPA: type II secretion system protein [Pyrinomonadaceae bacterium]|nr:type II secretion system protein [Pyrinomonadaceae bacterium]
MLTNRFKYNLQPPATAGGTDGFTLFELVVTLAVLSVLVVGTIPLSQNAVKRDKELRLRETLRQMRNAIDEFKRDTVGSCPQGSISTGNPTQGGRGADAQADPRSRVVIDDCTIFDSENLDRFPPDLDTLVKGVKIKQRGINMMGGSGIKDGQTQATDMNTTEEVIKVYLRELPKDPMTGEPDWKFRSSYQPGDDESWDNVNVFDVRSSSDEEGLNGVKYNEW